MAKTRGGFFSYLQPLFDFFTRKEEIQTENEGNVHRSGRKRTKFESNKTASLALSDTIEEPFIKKKIHVVTSTQSTNNNQPTFLLAMLLNNSFFNAQPQDDNPPPATKPPTISMRDRIHTLELQCKNETDKNKIDELNLKKVESISEIIIEHAMRRADLFFYLMIAVYKKNVRVYKDATVKQHGSGSQDLNTQGCHSSVIPNVKLEPISNSLLFQSSPVPDLENTQFADSLNMTVELPLIVNVFDGILEGKRQHSKEVKALLETLNQVSRGLNPKLGMNKYYKIMDNFFNHVEQNQIRKNKIESPKAFKKVWEFEKKGTFSMVYNGCMKEDYFYSLLRLNKYEIEKLKKEPAIVEIYYKRIQDEIYENKPILKSKRKNTL